MFMLFAVLALLGQLGVTVVAPILDGRAGEGAAAHVEQQGVTKHYAHNEASCAACVAGTILPLPVPGRAEPVATQLGLRTNPGRFDAPNPLDALLAASPRAPPALA